MAQEKKQTFTAKLEVANDAGGRFVRCPFDSKDVYGEARPPVIGTVNGQPFRSRLMVYGGKTYLGFTREVRDAAGIEEGMALKIVLERDTAPREIEVPEDLQRALDAEPALRDVFTKLAFTHRKEFVQSITEAKRPETRERRLAQTLEKLRARAAQS
ncbi:YdeI/OmpD-associated family protein [Corallococcus llansteffanensis]|nr:YdeI/OmpD-associated family protein [Corallococcus llansteffanensis]